MQVDLIKNTVLPYPKQCNACGKTHLVADVAITEHPLNPDAEVLWFDCECRSTLVVFRLKETV